MSAFWALFLLVGYGCLYGGGLVTVLRGWFGPAVTHPYIENLPLIGNLDLAKIIGLVTLAVLGLVIYLILNRPKSADMLIETENEMRKVTWPSGPETWTGTIAVITTVVVLLGYLFLADIVLTFFAKKALGGGS